MQFPKNWRCICTLCTPPYAAPGSAGKFFFEKNVFNFTLSRGWKYYKGLSHWSLSHLSLCSQLSIVLFHLLLSVYILKCNTSLNQTVCNMYKNWSTDITRKLQRIPIDWRLWNKATTYPFLQKKKEKRLKDKNTQVYIFCTDRKN